MSASLALAALGDVGSFLFSRKRSIGLLVPDIVLEEAHADELAITGHPVEQGAPISDHAYKIPAGVTIQAGWSNASINALLGGSLDGVIDSGGAQLLGGIGAFTEHYADSVYDQLLTLQASASLIDVYTGKRHYPNMLIRSVSTRTTAETEYSLIAVIVCQQVIVVSTSASKLPANVSPTATPADPATTNPAANAGTQQPAAASPNQSALSYLKEGLTGLLAGGT